ncbi:uncharacterized protein LOC134233377 [Saccostrea cucullata]|uniref:uncharacterized protein LOC134233377 n=1 Tax=Saccostrea cuccullata TaxID=36930 RepID=UPI002ED4CCD0
MNGNLMLCVCFLSVGVFVEKYECLNVPKFIASPSRLGTTNDKVHSLKTALLFHYINYFGACKPEKMHTMEVKICFACIDAACALIGERPKDRISASKNKLTKLCYLASRGKDVTRWFTIASQIAEVLCAACSELTTDEEKIVCEKRMCQ